MRKARTDIAGVLAFLFVVCYNCFTLGFTKNVEIALI